jgi:hypothetical protein
MSNQNIMNEEEKNEILLTDVNKNDIKETEQVLSEILRRL